MKSPLELNRKNDSKMTSGDIDFRLEIQRLKRDLEAKDLECELTLTLLEIKHLKRKIKDLENKLADENTPNTDNLLQFLSFLGSLIFIESISTFISQNFVNNWILLSFAAVGAIIAGTITVHRIRK